MIPARARILKDGDIRPGPVVYWMSRDQRARDNWALLFAQSLAKQKGTFACVVFSLVPSFQEATERQYGFMLKGLQLTESILLDLGIPFFLLVGQPVKTVARMVNELQASALIADFDPLRIKRLWKKKVADKIAIPFYEVDAHNIVPCKIASPKEEFAAYTFRPKMNKLLPEFLDEFPSLQPQKKVPGSLFTATNWAEVKKSLRIDKTVGEVKWIQPGELQALDAMESFFLKRLQQYAADRNDPSLNGQSNLSPYLHFGQISAQRIALETSKRFPQSASVQAFLEELIIRRELSDNFCYYNTRYDAFEGFQNWARTSLAAHCTDVREFTYDLAAFENAQTHDTLWNAAQLEMKHQGKMHGYMRMYWAKKILEWSESPSHALATAIFLNDKYGLDGRDPNGYTGCAWSIGGVHDRAWFERAIFGKIRYMNYNGCKRKFDIDAYIKNINSHTLKETP